ncbi:hypothetical protein ElyMa_002067600 [Elysia marginata]|uniref:Uncharacterized protein n=1 Tax=Elysia marginata TaxID=1093978 RepID=A0AAV4FA30_9GAST|nr:hypothetical protein ElyMa_002067600 [Elysia marginata]
MSTDKYILPLVVTTLGFVQMSRFTQTETLPTSHRYEYGPDFATERHRLRTESVFQGRFAVEKQLSGQMWAAA